MKIYLIEGSVLTPFRASDEAQVFINYNKAKEAFCDYVAGIKQLKGNNLHYVKTYNLVIDMVSYQYCGKNHYLRLREVEVEE